MFGMADHRFPIPIMTRIWLALCIALPGIAAKPGNTPPAHARHESPANAQIADLVSAVWTLISNVKKDFPEGYDFRILQGMMFRQLGDHTRANQAWQEVLNQDPQHVEVLSQLGMAALEMEDYENAVVHWQRALAINPRLPGLHQDIGFALLEAGQYHKAIESLLQALMLTPPSSRALDLLGQCYLQLKDYRKAQDAYRRAIQSDPQNAAAYYGLMTVCMRLQEPEQAGVYQARFKALTRKSTHFMRGGYIEKQDLAEMRKGAATLILQASDVYRRHGRQEKTDSLLVWARQLDSEQVLVSLKKEVIALQTRQQYQQALALMAELTELEPDLADNHLALGMLALKTRRLAQARTAFEHAIQLAPQLADAHRELARVYTHLRIEPKAALELAQRAVALAGTGEDYYVLSGTYIILQQIPEALSAMQKALAHDPTHPVYRQGFEFLRSQSAR